MAQVLKFREIPIKYLRRLERYLAEDFPYDNYYSITHKEWRYDSVDGLYCVVYSPRVPRGLDVYLMN